MMRFTIIIMMVNIRHGKGCLFNYDDQFDDDDDYEYDNDDDDDYDDDDDDFHKKNDIN